VFALKMGRQAYVAEFIGTFALVFFGTMSVIVFLPVLGMSSLASSFLAISLAQGLILMVVVYLFGPISGCHVNPAVTITAVALRKLPADDGVAYILAQVLGACLAGALDVLIQPGNGVLARFGLPAPQLAIGQSESMAALIELVITFFLMLAYYAVLYTDRVPQGASGLLIGMTLTVDVLIAGALTGGAANPARWLGSAVALLDFSSFWVYWVGPIAGALLAGFTYEKLLASGKEEKGKRR
jgi:MIP family channel proteins